jgi:hypothetical protein
VGDSGEGFSVTRIDGDDGASAAEAIEISCDRSDHSHPGFPKVMKVDQSDRGRDFTFPFSGRGRGLGVGSLGG